MEKFIIDFNFHLIIKECILIYEERHTSDLLQQSHEAHI